MANFNEPQRLRRIRSASTLLLTALALAGCGGGGGGSADGGSSSEPPPDARTTPPPTFSVGGTVTDLNGTLTLEENKSNEKLTITANGTFVFPTPYPNTAPYDVVVGFPRPPLQGCTVTNGSGTVDNANVSNIVVTCLNQGDVQISAISPTHGPARTLVTLTGTGFSTTQSENVVTLNNKLCLVQSATTTELVVIVPDQAGSGNFIVTRGGRVTAESPLFTYDITSVTVTTFVGSGVPGHEEGGGTAVQFLNPTGVAVNDEETLFVADSGNNRIRAVSPMGVVTTLAGSVLSGFTDGQGVSARFNLPNRLVVSGDFIYVTEAGNHAVRQISTGGSVSTPVGFGLNLPTGITSSLEIADTTHSRIMQLNKLTGELFVRAGTGTPGNADGKAEEAQFKFPLDVADCLDGTMVADLFNNNIRKIFDDAAAHATIVTTYAGGGSAQAGLQDTPRLDFSFVGPTGLACDRNGKLFVVDAGNIVNKILMITPSGIVTTLVASPVGFADGDGTSARFRGPQAIAVKPGSLIAVERPDSLFVADTANQRIRKIEWN